MPHPPHTEVAAPVLRRELGLTGQLLAGPAASFAALSALYYRTGEKCTGASRLALLAMPLAAGLVAACALVASRRAQARAARDAHDLPPRTSVRARFMAWCGVAINAFALLLAVALIIPMLLLRPCE